MNNIMDYSTYFFIPVKHAPHTLWVVYTVLLGY